MSNTKQSMYGLSRIDDEVQHTHAWRVSLRRRGTLYVKNFTDMKCGGKRKALRVAQRYRDEVVRMYPPMSRQEFSAIRRRNNQTGVTGVCRFVSSYRLKDGTIRYNWYWEAIWPTTLGEHESVRFSVNKFGERGAFERALAARRRGFKRIEGVFWACQPATQVVMKNYPRRSGRKAANLKAQKDRGQKRSRSRGSDASAMA